ncbi:Ribokinase-like protein [Thozetella sp. PMI_491]|nr:Ribokinase-like protein [Thozetella sp. PMI_491]
METEESRPGSQDSQGIDFVTLGMFIIDEIEYLPPTPPVKDIIGGAGTFSALGARLFSPPPVSKSVGWIVDQGSDFPESMTALIDSWQTSVLFRSTPDRLTTRGWNGYVDKSERRAFRYTTEKKRLVADDLTGPLLQSRSVHLVCSPLRCRELVTTLLEKRKAEAASRDNYVRPIIIWEPVPDRCVPNELLNCTNCLPLVDVCSPNHAELAGFMGSDGLDPETGEIDMAAVEQSCEQLLGSMPLQSYTLVVRAGEKGCYIARNGGRKRRAGGPSKKRKKLVGMHGGLQPDTDMEALFAGLMQDDDGAVAEEEIEVDPGMEKWLPPYFTDEEGKSKVVDPTGGGNTFLGALGVALVRGKSMEEACLWGSVAASFAIEQVGIPVIGTDENGEETWNGARVDDRLRELQGRL